MDRASKEAERIIIVLSHDFLSSSFTPSEWAVFFKKDPTGEKGLIVPVRVRKCKLDGLLSTINRIDLIGLKEEAAKKALLDGVKFERAKPSTLPGFPGSRSVTEKPRFPRALPQVWNVPFNRNRNFTGRRSLLTDLHDALNSGHYAAQTQAITGLGGVGKTQLTLEYVYSYINEYEIVWWLRSEEPSTLAADYVGLAGALNLPERTLADQNIVVDAVRRRLGQLEDWLLIFDNAAKPESIDAYLPQGGGGHVIISSRNQSWGGVARMLPVDIFTPAESIEFLRKRTGRDDEEAAKALAEALGNLPLALEQAGAYIQETGISLSAYLKLFQERQKELLSRGKPEAYPDTVVTTWDLSFEKASAEVPVSADLLTLCAFLAPDEIPKSLLIDGVEYLPEPLASAVTDEMVLNDAIAALKRYSLMTVADDTLTVHRLVQAVTRDRLSEEVQKRWSAAAIGMVNDAFPYKIYDVQTWDECSVLLPQAVAAAEQAERLEANPEATGRLLNQMGLYLRGRAEFSEAKSALERALEIDEKVYGPDHPNVAIRVNNLGGVLEDLGDLAGAKKSYERALKIFQVRLGEEHPSTKTVRRNLELLGR